MAINNEDFICKNCGHQLDWEDTIDTEGGINEGYIIERQLWCCSNCNKNYIIEQKADIGEGDINIIYYEEA